jgi:hypothetical protein
MHLKHLNSVLSNTHNPYFVALIMLRLLLLLILHGAGGGLQH